MTAKQLTIDKHQATIDLFQQCSEQTINAIFHEGLVQSFTKNELIYSNTNQQVHILLNGVVKICRKNNQDQVMIKDVIYPGSFFGEDVLFSTTASDECAICIDPKTSVLSIPKEKFKALTTSHPSLISLLLQELGKKLIQKEEKLASFHFNDAKSRILHFIRTTAQKNGIQVGYEVLIKHSFTQQDIANITGTSRQTVTFVLNELKKNNIIHFDRKRILIRDMEQL